jgi:hypothetical protein
MHASLSACTWPKPNPTVTRSRHCQPSQPAAGGLAGRLGCDQSREATMASSHAPAVSQPHLMERPDAKCPNNPSRMQALARARQQRGTATAWREYVTYAPTLIHIRPYESHYSMMCSRELCSLIAAYLDGFCSFPTPIASRPSYRDPATTNSWVLARCARV